MREHQGAGPRKVSRDSGTVFLRLWGIELFRFTRALKSKREVAKVEPWKHKKGEGTTDLNTCLGMEFNLTLEKPLHPQALEGSRGEAL